MWWALELADTGLLSLALARIRICAHEDVGLAAPDAVMFALAAVDLAWEWRKRDDGAWRMPLGNAIRTLCRSPKSREGDHFQAAILGMRASGTPLAMPDWALDKHTSRGLRLGRGLQHFQDVGAQLDPPASDPYEDQAYAYWRATGS